jgi:sporulation protein YlmC with PRC-barrel domain
MPHYGILREYSFEGEAEDLRGADIYGVNDEKLGTIDDVIFDHSTGEIRHVVLKTSGIFSRKKIMVPANRLAPYGKHEDKFYAELDKERLEMLPEFDEKMLKGDFEWASYEKEYEKRWNDGAVLYNKDTGRVITPRTEEVPGGRGTPLNPEARRSLERDFTPQRMGKEDDLLGVASGTGKTQLRPSKPSIAGKEAVHPPGEEPVREVMSPMGSELEIPPESSGVPRRDPLRERHTSRPDDPAERRPTVGESVPGGLHKGRRWSGFQERLRSRRDRIVVDCPRCGSQVKIA